MYVVKRDGRTEPVAFDKITARIRKLCYGLDPHYVDPTKVAAKVIAGLYDGITTRELDMLAAETCALLDARRMALQLARQLAFLDLLENRGCDALPHSRFNHRFACLPPPLPSCSPHLQAPTRPRTTLTGPRWRRASPSPTCTSRRTAASRRTRSACASTSTPR